MSFENNGLFKSYYIIINLHPRVTIYGVYQDLGYATFALATVNNAIQVTSPYIDIFLIFTVLRSRPTSVFVAGYLEERKALRPYM